MIATRSKDIFRKQGFEAFDFLQTEDIGGKFVQPATNSLHTCPYAINVPAGDGHFSHGFWCPVWLPQLFPARGRQEEWTDDAFYSFAKTGKKEDS